MFDVVRNARRAAAGAPSLPRSTQPDPLLALDIEHREALAAYKATDAGDAEFEAVAERQTGLVDKLVNTTATSLEGVLVKLRYVLDYVDETSDIGDIGGTIDFLHDAIEAIERFAA